MQPPRSEAGRSHNGIRPDPSAAAMRVEALYREHGATVRRICAGLVGGRGDAEDAAQQVFLSAQRALLNGAAPRNPRAWLATIARHECASRLQSPVAAPALDEPGDGVRLDPPAELIRRAELAAVWQAIEELPRAQREALLLREIRGFSYQQLADALALSRPSVRSLLSRARRRLRACLKDVSAALGGASWVDAVARQLAGGSGQVGSAVTKAAAVGLGAAALTSGVVVGPAGVPHNERPQATASPRPARPARPERVATVDVVRRPPAPVAHVTVVRPRGAASEQHRGHVERRERSERSGRDRHRDEPAEETVAVLPPPPAAPAPSPDDRGAERTISANDPPVADGGHGSDGGPGSTNSGSSPPETQPAPSDDSGPGSSSDGSSSLSSGPSPDGDHGGGSGSSGD